MLRFVYGHTDVTKFGNSMFNFLLRCLFKNFSDQFNRRNVIYFKTMANCVFGL